MTRLPSILAHLVYLPPIFNVMMLEWASITSPYSKYGDTWAVLPIIVMFFAVTVIHFMLLIKKHWAARYIAYAAAHIPASFMIGVYCLARISKDSL